MRYFFPIALCLFAASCMPSEQARARYEAAFFGHQGSFVVPAESIVDVWRRYYDLLCQGGLADCIDRDLSMLTGSEVSRFYIPVDLGTQEVTLQSWIQEDSVLFLFEFITTDDEDPSWKHKKQRDARPVISELAFHMQTGLTIEDFE